MNKERKREVKRMGEWAEYEAIKEDQRRALSCTKSRYIKMCQEAKEVQEEWMRISKEKRYGTLIRYRTFLGIVVPTDRPLEFEGLSAVVPETLAFRTWLKEGETLIVTAVKLEPYDDRGTPLFRQDQLQDMIFLGIPAFLIQNTFCKWCRENLRYTEEFTLMEELWLAYVMYKKYKKIWDDEKEEWITDVAYLDVVDAVLCPKLDKIISLATCTEGMNFHKCPYYMGRREKKGRKEILCSYPFIKVNGKWRKNED